MTVVEKLLASPFKYGWVGNKHIGFKGGVQLCVRLYLDELDSHDPEKAGQNIVAALSTQAIPATVADSGEPPVIRRAVKIDETDNASRFSDIEQNYLKALLLQGVLMVAEKDGRTVLRFRSPQDDLTRRAILGIVRRIADGHDLPLERSYAIGASHVFSGDSIKIDHPAIVKSLHGKLVPQDPRGVTHVAALRAEP